MRMNGIIASSILVIDVMSVTHWTVPLLSAFPIEIETYTSVIPACTHSEFLA